MSGNQGQSFEGQHFLLTPKNEIKCLLDPDSIHSESLSMR